MTGNLKSEHAPARQAAPAATSQARRVFDMHGWSPTDVGVTILATIAVFHVLYFGYALLFPVTLAYVLNLVLKPPVLAMQRWHLPPPIGAALLMICCAAVGLLGIELVIAPAQQWIDDVPGQMEKAMGKLKSVSTPFEKLQDA